MMLLLLLLLVMLMMMMTNRKIDKKGNMCITYVMMPFAITCTHT